MVNGWSGRHDNFPGFFCSTFQPTPSFFPLITVCTILLVTVDRRGLPISHSCHHSAITFVIFSERKVITQNLSQFRGMVLKKLQFCQLENILRFSFPFAPWTQHSLGAPLYFWLYVCQIPWILSLSDQSSLFQLSCICNTEHKERSIRISFQFLPWF